MSKRPQGSAVPKGHSNTTSKGKLKVEWKGYVNIELNTQMKDGINRITEQGEFVEKAFTALEGTSYDVKIRWDDYNQCWSASLYCTDPANPNGGWCLSLRGDSWWKAIVRLFYVHFTVYEENWSAQGMAGWSDEQW